MENEMTPLPADAEQRIEKALAHHVGMGCPEPECDPTRPHGAFFQHLAEEVLKVLRGSNGEPLRPIDDFMPCLAAGWHQSSTRHRRAQCSASPLPASPPPAPGGTGPCLRRVDGVRCTGQYDAGGRCTTCGDLD